MMLNLQMYHQQKFRKMLPILCRVSDLPEQSITLRIPVPELRRMSHASIEEMVLDAWVSPTAVELKIPVAIAKARKMQAEGRTLVTRERTTANMDKNTFTFQLYQV